MFLHEIFHQGLKARIANWPTLVLGKLLLNLTHCTKYSKTHSAATQRHQGQVFSLFCSHVSLDVLLPHSHTYTHTLISLSQSATCTLIVLTDKDHPDQKASHFLPPKTEAPLTDKNHLGDRLLTDTAANYLWQIQEEKGRLIKHFTLIWLPASG